MTVSSCVPLRTDTQRRRLLFASVGLLGALVAGCASPSRIEGPDAGPSFDRTGRFALLVDRRHAEQEAVQGGFAWRDTAAGQRLDLANPLGNTLARIDLQPGRAVLTRSNGAVEQAASPDALVEQVLGSPIPVAGLRYWLQGRLAPGPAQHVEKDAEGRLFRFAQQGWRVELSRYDELGPRLLRLRRTEAARDISLRLVVDGQ